MSSVHPVPQYPGYGYSTLCIRPEFLHVLYARATIPGTSGSSVRFSYPYPNFCSFFRTFIPRTRTSVRFLGHSYPYPELLLVLYTPCHNTRGTGTAPFVPARSFCEFCTPMPQCPELLEFCYSFIPVPETSVSSVRLPYPEPESTNPTEHNLWFITTNNAA